MNLKVRGTKYEVRAYSLNPYMLLSGLTFSHLCLLHTALDIGVRAVCRISYYLLGTWYIVLSNAERPVQNGEVGNSANGTIPYFVSRISYLVHCTLYFVQK